MTSTDEREELRAAVRALLDRTPPVRIGPDEPPRYDDAAWERLAGEVGAFGLAVPEEHGGAGCGLAETAVVCEELGRAVAPLPYLGSAVLATQALRGCGATRDLPALASGTRVAALAWAEDGSWDISAVRTVAGPGPTLTGVKGHVLDGARADVLLVLARRERGGPGTALFRVDPAAPGVRVEELPTMDTTRPQARVRLEQAPAVHAGDADAMTEHLMAVAATALAAEQLGGAQRCLDLTVTHAKERVQFGRPIGSFQAIRHRIADMYTLVESARSVSHAAAHAAGTPEFPLRAAIAKAYCSEAFHAVAAETVQVHGGIGFTWEHEAHLHLKRAHSSTHLFGAPAWHRGRLWTLAVRGEPDRHTAAPRL